MECVRSKRVMAMMVMMVMMEEKIEEVEGRCCCRSGGMLLQVRAGRIGKEAEADSTQDVDGKGKKSGRWPETERVYADVWLGSGSTLSCLP